MANENRERFWRRRASALSRRVNAGWFLEKAAPLWIGCGVVFALVVLMVRSLHAGSTPGAMLLAVAGGGTALLIAAAAFLLARRHFIDQKTALTRLEDRLGLHNSLTAAAHGVADWPPLPGGELQDFSGGLRWNAPAVVFPLLSAALLVLAAILIPIPESTAAAKLPPNEPAAWEQMEKWINALEEESLFDEEAIEETREKIEELRNQPEEDWFSHGNMEATDSMREALGRDLQQTARQLQTLERDLAALQNYAGQMNENSREMLLKEYDEALRDLELGGMKLDPEMMEQLKNLDLSQLAQSQMNGMTKEQLEALRKKLQSGCQ